MSGGLTPVPSYVTPMVDKMGIMTTLWQAFFGSVKTYLTPVGQSGPTAFRPVSSSQVPLYVGQPYFDTSLGKPIWVQSISPTVWADATGTPV